MKSISLRKPQFTVGKKMFYLKQKKLFELFQLNKKNPLRKNNNLIKIICNMKLIKNIYFRIKSKQKSFIIKNKNKIINKINLKILKNLSKQIETGNYNWIYNIRINNEHISHFKNQIVQKLIELILITIYEPIFQTLEYNHGFRYKKSPQTVIQRLKIQNQKLTYGLKNKIKKSNRTINNKLFIKILKKKIIDFKFVTLIKNWVKNKTRSFLLHNVYMHEFDLFVSKKIKIVKRIELGMVQANLKQFELYPKFMINLFSIKQQILKIKHISKLNIKAFQKLKKDLKINKRKQIKFKIQNKRKKYTQIIYKRYNNSWILLTNYDFYRIENIKNILTKWLKKNLEINWNKILTINLIKKKLNYLGFIFFTIFPRIKKMYYKNKIQTKRKKKIILFIGIDYLYIKSKLVKKGFIMPNNKPIHTNIYLNLKPFQILKKFEQNLKILIKYYYNLITHKNDLNYYYYIYKFSYLKTIAYKIKKSITYISTYSSKNLKR